MVCVFACFKMLHRMLKMYSLKGPNFHELPWGLSIKHIRKIFRKTNISNPLIHTHVCVSGGNVSFSENFPYVINGWPLHAFCLQNKLLFVMHAAVTYVKSNLLFADHMTSLLFYFSITQMWWKYKKSGLVALTFSLDHCNFTQKWKTRS